MLQFSCCICLRMNIADFFHLKASLKGNRIINSTTDKENVFRIHLFGCKPLKSLFILDNSLNFLRNALKFFNISGILFFCNLSSDLCELNCKCISCDQLCAVCFCCRNCNLRSCQCIVYIVCLSGNRRTDYIHDTKCLYSLFL